ncbi:MAG: prolipoprotein diacylglyceryl transferase [Methylacidiphilales bacterium]|nr:prolipoprotein diacylglyceryl transferase [Candidatus Methylacidiphilales bacterium]
MNLNSVHPGSVYSLLMLLGIVASFIFWSRLAKHDEKLLGIYAAGLAGAFLGAKLMYLLAEGWLHFGARDMWLQLMTGKSILGALMGGYLAVELAKRFVGYRASTGDWFALVVPAGVLIGRVGCLFQGCCLGALCEPAWYTLRDNDGFTRWPAVPLEMIFNVLALLVFLILRKCRVLPGQHFHLYLIGYGLFRFANEFMRDTPRIIGGWSGYQIGALAVALLGIIGFVRRAREPKGSNR